ncbi:hypothetical protein LX97_00717 [Nonlabens dokdonensis]|jgi:hypothetical protein|uniref:Tryptophan-rich sensory protein n=2 Tax=Nonlabens dokdonensis TaxID=328515 RepID=L7WAV3_NONDD|nr:hypothetical protein [Nonlabens dokdonensis]AGC76043.1 hypothetical protein DDD_0916 [Nonlabens dokdonensis DSW-6]PZX43715.1 hypothetical protein LX97_00717 [Nonlabens dokdonensis]
MSKKTTSILNLVSVIILIAWNGYANTGNYNGKSVGELSAEYDNLFTPASYAFSIWGIIFLMLTVFGIYGVYVAFSKKHQEAKKDYRSDFLLTTSPWFLAANIFCGLWVALWLDENIAASVVMMFGILFCLLICVRQLDMEIWDAPFPIIAFVWWPLCLYSGWISVATIANVAAWLNGTYEIAVETQVTITIVMITVAFIINSLMIWMRNMREFALVGVWALVAIYVRFQSSVDMIDVSSSSLISYTALGLAIALFIQTGIHGYRNVKTNPGKKFMEWRESK